MALRDNFSAKVKRTLALRVNSVCSKPDCRAPTSGPEVGEQGAINLGVAAHITAAAKGGERYDSDLTVAERSAISNGIWLCQNCAKLVDSDVLRFPPQLLRKWKADTELLAYEQLGNPLPYGRTAALLPWPKRAGAPRFRMEPRLYRGERLLCQFTISDASPSPGGVEARWFGAGVEMEWREPMPENRPGCFRMEPVPMAPQPPVDQVSFEVRFNLEDGQHWGRWTWSLREHDKGHWEIEAHLGSQFQPTEYDGGAGP